jgi:hypothetical protein
MGSPVEVGQERKLFAWRMVRTWLASLIVSIGITCIFD